MAPDGDDGAEIQKWVSARPIHQTRDGEKMFSVMKVYCPICRGDMDGMLGYGREAKCCDKECYEEWEWRKTLAILGKAYYPRIGNTRWTAPEEATP
jgi:hypothetical protein